VGGEPPAKDADEAPLRHVRKSLPHDSALRHVTGLAQYIDDIREPEGTLHIAVGQSPRARGKLVALDLDAVRAAPGVVRCSPPPTSQGKTTSRPPSATTRCSREGEVAFHGQALFAVVATTATIAAAGRDARPGRDPCTSGRAVTVEDALERDETVLPGYAFGRGDADARHRGRAPLRA
jgi:xanthine dehydrogenase large subunit